MYCHVGPKLMKVALTEFLNPRVLLTYLKKQFLLIEQYDA